MTSMKLRAFAGACVVALVGCTGAVDIASGERVGVAEDDLLRMNRCMFVFAQNPDPPKGSDAAVYWHNYASGENRVRTLINGCEVDYPMATTAAGWVMEATGDFDRDGQKDILWRNYQTGQNSLWFMRDAANYVTTPLIAYMPDRHWHVGGVADFDGDQKVDILWTNVMTGDTLYWRMDGANMLGTVDMGQNPARARSIGAVGDFDRDGKADVLWRDYENGQNLLMFANRDFKYLPVAGVNWNLDGALDWNQDGMPDLAWREETTGANSIWTMNGSTPTAYLTTAAETDLNWQMVGSSIPRLRKTEDALIVDIFEDVLGRTPAPSEADAWRANLDTNGWTLRRMRDGLASSQESRMTILSVFHNVLHRPPTKSEFDTWQSNIKGDWTIGAMIWSLSNLPGAGGPVTYPAADGTTFFYQESSKTGVVSASGTDKSGTKRAIEISSTKAFSGISNGVKQWTNGQLTFTAALNYAFDGSILDITMGGLHEGFEYTQNEGGGVSYASVLLRHWTCSNPNFDSTCVRQNYAGQIDKQTRHLSWTGGVVPPSNAYLSAESLETRYFQSVFDDLNVGVDATFATGVAWFDATPWYAHTSGDVERVTQEISDKHFAEWVLGTVGAGLAAAAGLLIAPVALGVAVGVVIGGIAGYGVFVVDEKCFSRDGDDCNPQKTE